MGGVERRRSEETWTAAFLMLFAVTLFSVNAAANPGTYRADFSTPAEGITYLFFANLPIDVFLFATALYFVYRVAGSDAGHTPRRTLVFLARVLTGSIVIAFIGALTDFYAFYDKTFSGGYVFWTGHSNAFFGSTEFFLALMGIFVSIYAVTFLVIRLDWNLSLLPAVAITTLNPLAWIIVTSDSRAFPLILGILFAFFSCASVAALAYWHLHAFEDKALSEDNIHGEKEELRG